MQILILGMHRSGSSVVTRLINMMGVYLGPENTVMLPQGDNDKGFWERQDAADLNDCILSRRGASWSDVAPWLTSTAGEMLEKSDAIEVQELLHRIDSHRPWAIKDPRISLTHSIWLKNLEFPILLLVYRNPLSIAQSLNRRNGLSIELGLALWEAYTISAIKATHGRLSIIISFERLFDNPLRELGWLKSGLEDAGVTGLRLPSGTEVKGFLSDERLHNRLDHEYAESLNLFQQELDSKFKNNAFDPDYVQNLEVSKEALEILIAHHEDCLSSGEYVSDDGGESFYQDTLFRNYERAQAGHLKRIEDIEMELKRIEDIEMELKREEVGLIAQIGHVQSELNSLAGKQLVASQMLQSYQTSLVGRLGQLLGKLYKIITFRPRAANGLESAIEVLSASEITQDEKNNEKQKNKAHLLADLVIFAVKNPVTVMRLISLLRLKSLSKWFVNSPASKVEDLLGPRMEVFAPHYRRRDINYEINRDLDPATIIFQESKHPKVSIVIPVYNQWDHTKNCLFSIMINTKGIDYEVIVADDCSTDETQKELSLVSNVRHIRHASNLKFLKNCNAAIDQARGEYILLLNNDTMVLANWLDGLLQCFELDGQVGMAGPKLLFDDGRVQEAGGIIWNDASGWNFGRGMDPLRPEVNYKREVDYVSGACLLIKKADWERVGGFDERFCPAYYEDTDLAFEIRKLGKKVVYQPSSEVVHFEGVSHGVDLNSGLKAYQVNNQQKFQEKWAKDLTANHYINGEKVFLARDRRDFKGTILVIDHYVPHYDRDAGSRSTFQYLKLFIEMGYKVVFLADNFYQHEPYTGEMRQLGIEVLTGPWYAQNWKDWLAEESKYIDYIYLHRPHISENYIDFINALAHRPRTIYFGHDLHFLRTQREAELHDDKRLFSDAERWKSRELSLFRKVDLSLYPSAVEVGEVKKIDQSIKVSAIPLNIYSDVGSLDDDDDDVAEEFSRRTRITFVGGFGHPPNKDAMKWFVTDVMPLITRSNDAIVLSIVGSGIDQDITELADEHVQVLGTLSDEQLSKVYSETKIAVVPLRFGAGVKGKVLESLHNGVPVVTTGVGAEGLPEVDNALKIEDDAAQFATAVLNLYESEVLWSRAVAAGYAMISEHFSREAAIRALQPFFDKG